MFMLLSVLALCFLSEITLLAIFDNEISLFHMQHNTKQTCTVSVFQNIKQLCPREQQENKPVSISPAFTTINSALINPP